MPSRPGKPGRVTTIREGSWPPCPVAARLTTADIEAADEYYSSLAP
jgi:hypothetical protein